MLQYGVDQYRKIVYTGNILNLTGFFVKFKDPRYPKEFDIICNTDRKRETYEN